MVPGKESLGLVSPNMTRPVLTTLSPSQTMGTTGHVLDKSGEEFLPTEVGVVLLQMFLASLHEFHGDQFEALLLETFDDITHESPLDAVGLDHDESSLAVRVGLGHRSKVI